MRAAPTVFTLSFAAGLLAAGPAGAMGFGKVANATQLGQRLNFATLVRLEPDESLERQCVFAEVMVGDNRLQPGQVRVTLEGGPDDPDRTVRITTSAVIDEPVVTVSITLGCASRVTRKFVAFIDPPGIDLAQSVPTDTALLVPQRADSQVEPLLAIVEREAPRRAVASPPAQRLAANAADPGTARRPRARLATETADRRVALVHKPAAARLVAATPPRPPRARLQLEAPPLLAARSAEPAAPASASPPVLAAAPAPVVVPASVPDAAAQAESIASEHRRIQALEDGMSRLRSESAATQKMLVGLQAKVRDAESERYANPVVYALASLCALLALGWAAAMHRARGRRAGQWWAAPATVDLVERTASHDPIRDLSPTAVTPPEFTPAVLLADAPLGSVDLSLPGLFVPGVATTPGATGARETQPIPLLAESSVEELIDLEQQAEFFIVLGQDDAAIDLLTNHVTGDGCTSPLPFLKLLEIHHRRGDEAAYESIRAKFNRRFHAYAPDWHAHIREGRTLEEYPEVLTMLQRLWGTPPAAMAALDASVFRRAQSDATFDLPAYRELLFLYAIARDRAENDEPETAGVVDLLLPLDSTAHLEAHLEAHPDVPRQTLPPRSSDGRSMDFQSSEFLTAPLDLDVTLADLPPRPGSAIHSRPKPSNRYESIETVPSALRLSTGYSGDSAFVDLELEPVGQGVPDSVR